MIVLGADMHKASHSVAAVAAGTGEVVSDKMVQVGERGFVAVLDWARSLDDQRVWALEDCRHVSGSFERFLLVSGERVVRVATKLMADTRRAARSRGKSDAIDALAVAGLSDVLCGVGVTDAAPLGPRKAPRVQAENQC